MTGKSKAESEMVMDIGFACVNCGAEYHGEIGMGSKEVRDREITIMGRTGGENLLGSM